MAASATAAKGTDDFSARQRIGPPLCGCFSLNEGLFQYTDINFPVSCFLKEHHLLAQLMILSTENNVRIDAATIYHDRKTTECAPILCAYNGNGLTSLDTITRFNQILCVVGIHRFQSITVAYHDDMSVGSTIS